MYLLRRISSGIVFIIGCQACVLIPQKYRSASTQVTPMYTQLYATLGYKHRTHGQGKTRVALRLHKDHCIWFSITTLWGLELVRGKMTPEKVALLYPMRQAYTVCSYEQLQKQWPGPWTYATIQALLLGELPQNPTTQGPGEQSIWQCQHDVPTGQIVQLDTKTCQGPLKVFYSHFKPRHSGAQLWKKILFEAYGDQLTKPVMTVTLNQHKAKIVQGAIKAPFDIPKHYEPK